MTEDNRSRRDFYDGWAPKYDWGMGLGALLRGFSDNRERRKLVEKLGLQPGHRVLEVSVGTGSNLPLVAEGADPEGRLVGLDISTGMLRQCEKKVQRRGLSADLIEGEAAHLPLADDSFDAVLHFGGINEFDDIKQAITEMMRVAKPGSKIVISDEGFNPNKRPPLLTRLVARLIPQYDELPPTDLIPDEAKDLHVSWFRAEACYIIDFVNP